MGLDGVALVIEVEDHFGITLQDSSAERILTVGDLVELIHGRLMAAQDSYCPTLSTFLKLRATVRFRVTPPSGWETFGDVTIKIIGTTMATKQLNLRTIEDVFDELRPIIVETLGVDISEVVLTARFIEDLDVG